MKIFTVVTVLFGSISSFGQGTDAGKPMVDPFVRGLLKVQGAHAPVMTQKTTAPIQRLTGRSEYSGATGAIVDSFSVKYSGARGSRFNAELMDFGQWIGPGFAGFTDMIFGFNGDGRLYNQNMGPDILGDTIHQYSYLPTTPYAYGHFADQFHSYDGSNNLLDEFWMGDAAMGGGSEQYVMRYNAHSQIVRASRLTGSGVSVDTTHTAFFIYNGDNQVVIDSITEYNPFTGSFEPSTKYDYSYDGLGNMTLGRSWKWSSGWQPGKSFTMTYYPGTHQLKTCIIDTLFSGGTAETLDSFGYTTGVNYTTFSKHVDYSMPGGPQVFEHMRHIGSTGLPDTIRAYDRSLGNHYRYVYTYNEYNNPVKMTEYDSNSSSTFVNSLNTYYYYELYQPAGVSPSVPINAVVALYPNPVSNTLCVVRNSYDPSKAETITICNTEGSVLSKKTLYRTKETEELSVSELIPGVYTIYVECDGLTEAKKIIKL